MKLMTQNIQDMKLTSAHSVSDPSSKTSHLNPWEQSHGKPDNKDKRENESDEGRHTGDPLIAHRISQPSGPLLLARINQDQNESQPTTIAPHRK
ncbi:uncharacterized protein PGTG_21456 [Puccinia graminis f. sp. tritici CRL 75-36-700-3]|uniref:Uncharacterized protein n=1 Tax=Puccinia graminis f. sp. tritici (strain CRL 75-36-700-3 / race SCCL) TaxID=418459 RepID=H6QRH4_PUCGT|nr:uncharacterized protein PGTG_21456 [Puccinia graminis f. sp. tritici CRL 75-36-700-3]EHS63261.1 hypothetical protein PGTG_21456 [Puccinia graminis f. sp. tritici CRL 75-36-700-3]